MARRTRRYAPSTYPHPQDAAIRRPLSLYSSGGPVSGEPIAPRYLERASASEANMYPPPLAIPSSAAEPVAFLNLDMEVVKASPTFMDAIGISDIRGRALFDLVTPSERTKVQGHQLVLQEERSRKDPMYLPPIFGKQEEERVFETLRFDAEELARIQMDRRDMLAFAAPGGQLRSFLTEIWGGFLGFASFHRTPTTTTDARPESWSESRFQPWYWFRHAFVCGVPNPA
ncbi:hypothetical protein HYQ45_007895 [Verticillium longisporum]|uniref:PAS domain-containing protein n=1 Tax=Verticillium longisporum TaxID=100787 RepID=A0A8I2ZN82_VERLO|nr:hypothetical protein HYQ45_007895 [Verticillium longisporum]